MRVATQMIDLNSFGQPKEKRRKTAVAEKEKFTSGAIIKVKVRNFVTYASTEFSLSPSLNMIIGPNGTGKSTFVCAVCLGLGGGPTLLGRQKVVGEFIKNGEESATVEITLKNKEGHRDLVVKREIFKSNDKSDWYLHGKPVSERKVKSVLSELNIQLDNLCQFLPQEKVADFAKLTPENLLIETQRAIDIKSLNDHQNLIHLDNKRIELATLLEVKEKELERHISQREHYEEAARKYEAFQNKKADLETHENIMPWAHLNDFKAQVDELKELRNECKRRLHEFDNNPLRLDNIIHNLGVELDGYRNSFRDLKSQNKANLEGVETAKKGLDQLDRRKIKIQTKIDSFAQNREEVKRTLEQTREVKEREEENLRNLAEYDDEAVKKLDNLVDRLYDQTSEIEEKLRREDSSFRSIGGIIKNDENRMDSLKREMKTEDRISILDDRGRNNQGGSGGRNQTKDQTKRAVIELRTNLKQYRQDIFEPPCLTVTAPDPLYAAYLDKIVDSMTQISLTARNKETYDNFTREIIDEKRINAPFRYLSNRQLQGQFTREQLNEFGFECYLVDVLNGPAPVIQMLREQSFIHDIPISKKPLTAQQIERLKTPAQNGQLLFRKFFSGEELYSISISRYGNRQSIVKSERLNKNNILFSTGGLSKERKAEIIGKIKECEVSRDANIEKQEKVGETLKQLHQQRDYIAKESHDKNEEKRKLGKVKKEREKCLQRINTASEKIAKFERDLAADRSSELMRAKLELKRLAEQRVAAVANVANSLATYNTEAEEISLLGVKMFVVENKKRAFEELNHGMVGQRQSLVNELHRAKLAIQDLKNNSGFHEWQQQTKQYEGDELETLRGLVQQYTEAGSLSVSFIQGVIGGIKAELGLLSNSSRSSIGELKQLNSKIEGLNEEIPILRQHVKQLIHEIKTIQESWEPKLQSIVNKISAKFSAIFPSVGSAGEVQLVKAEKFQDWKLEILVAFREESDLKPLDSHTQSGGERAVSTVYFMISLQNLTNSPFRVVDEINQGMDARNERIVHENMVKVACQENTSQYFLITPKLLTDLYYHPKMRVHCILAGPWIPNPSNNEKYLELGTTSCY